LIDAAATHHKVFHPEKKKKEEKLKFICRTFLGQTSNATALEIFRFSFYIYINIFFFIQPAGAGNSKCLA